MGTTLQGVANRIYRATARVIGAALGSSELVERVYVHRSLAAGEISIGRSDVDLAIVTGREIAQPDDVRALLSLLRKVRLLRAGTRVLGECEIHGPGEAERWARTEPFWGSINRRTAFFVYGPAFELPHATIEIEHSAARTVAWLASHLAGAVGRRDGRALRKFALDAWNGYATAVGITPEPYTDRRQCEQSCRAHGGWKLPADLSRHPDVAFQLYCDIGARLHERLQGPLECMREPLVFRASLPPRPEPRTFVILPHSRSSPLAEARAPDALLATPELLDLFITYCSPFSWDLMPEAATRLGLRRPAPEAFLRSCRYLATPFRLRGPGFIHAHTQGAVGRLVLVRHALRSLSEGRTPEPLSPDQWAEIGATPTSLRRYYCELYPRLHRELATIWAMLDDLGSAGLPSGGRPPS